MRTKLQADAFVAGPPTGLALRQPASGLAMSRIRMRTQRRTNLPARMQEEGLKEGEKAGEAKPAEDPYAVKQSIPSWAKEENQWEIDAAKGEDAGDAQKKAVAVLTGVVAMALSVAYLAMVTFLESRGPLKPPPCEATGTCEDAADALETAALSLKHVLLMALHL